MLGLPVHHQLPEFTQTHVHWVRDAIQPFSFSVGPFSSCPQSLPASGSFPMSQLFAWEGQSIGVSASASVLPMNTHDWSPLGWTGWISLHSKRLLRVFSYYCCNKGSHHNWRYFSKCISFVEIMFAFLHKLDSLTCIQQLSLDFPLLGVAENDYGVVLLLSKQLLLRCFLKAKSSWIEQDSSLTYTHLSPLP